METVQVDGGQDVIQLRDDNVELSQQFNFAASDCCINVQLPRHRNEVFLENLEGYDAGARTAVLRQQMECAPALRWLRSVVCVN